jgi:hypothetical protein
MKYLLILFFALGTFFAQAQTSKGGFLVSGGISFIHRNDEYPSSSSTKYSSLSITPRVGYFIKNNFAIGLSLPLSLTDQMSNSIHGSYGAKSWSLGTGPFIRYYFPLTEKLFVLTEAGYSWNTNHTKYSENGSFQKEKARQLTLGAGAAYFINKNVAIELLAGYRKTTESLAEATTSGIRLEGGLQIYLSR